MKDSKIRKQIRLSNYDYSENGYYFVTICSASRQNIYANYKIPVGAGLASARDNCLASTRGNEDTRNNNLVLSIIGKIIDRKWNDIPNQYDNVDLDEYVIMPNHVHGIIVINAKKRADARPAPTVSDIICSFKSRCSVEYLRYIKQNNLNISGKIWQRSFYDHVIRSERSLNAIREYITGNPINWEQDIENLLNL